MTLFSVYANTVYLYLQNALQTGGYCFIDAVAVRCHIFFKVGGKRFPLFCRSWRKLNLAAFFYCNFVSKGLVIKPEYFVWRLLKNLMIYLLLYFHNFTRAILLIFATILSIFTAISFIDQAVLFSLSRTNHICCKTALWSIPLLPKVPPF